MTDEIDWEKWRVERDARIAAEDAERSRVWELERKAERDYEAELSDRVGHYATMAGLSVRLAELRKQTQCSDTSAWKNRLGRAIAEEARRNPDQATAWQIIMFDLGVQFTPAQRMARSRERKRAIRTATDNRTCPVCQEPMIHKRADAKVCSDICRVRWHRGALPARVRPAAAGRD
jgi:hypothetical protein